MSSTIQNILGTIIINITNIYVWCKLLNKKPNLKSTKTWIVFVLMCVITVMNYFYNNKFIRIVTITVVMAIFIKILFKDKTNKSILASVTTQFLYMISEIIFAFSLVYIFNVNPDKFTTMYFGTILTNFVISLVVITLIQFKIFNKFYNQMINITDKIKANMLVILLLILMIAINILYMTPHYNSSFTYIMIFNTTLTFICIAIIINSLYNKNKYIKVYDKYNTTLNSLKEYENILDRYRISNHENKNQLLTIRNMISKSNKKAISYIDTIVENKIKDSDKAMVDVSKIPAGGLRGLIYSKVLLINNMKINYDLEISHDVRTTSLINSIDDSTMLDICKIVGVYLDNAIEAVTAIDKKYISIEMYLDNSELVISISNTYKGKIEIEKIHQKGYTSKGKEHGYGLSLVAEIIEGNKKLSNSMKISKEAFTQILKIKM